MADAGSRPFRVLCLDGGGMRGVFTAAFLAGTEEILGDRLASHLDLVAGTSAGGLIALGLASGRSGQQMLDLFRDHGRDIFSGSWPGRQMFMPKYSRKGLDRLLQEEFGELRMRDLSLPTCISAYEAVSGQTRVFKTFHVDGGVWANNPSMIAITEAVRRLGQGLTDIRLLSVGTVAPRAQIKSFRKGRRMGLVAWAKPAIALLQGGPAMGNHFQALHLLGADHYLRIGDRAEQAAPVALDDVDACQPLAAIGHRAALDNWPQVKELLGIGAPAPPSPEATS